MDWNKINTLLSVVHQAAAAGPQFNFITAAAEAELHATFNATDEAEVAEDEPLSEDESADEPTIFTPATSRRV